MTTQPVIPRATLVRVALKAAADAGADDCEIEIVLGRTIAQLRAMAASGSPDLPDPDETRWIGDAFRMWTARAAGAAPAPAPAPAPGPAPTAAATTTMATHRITNAEFLAAIFGTDPAMPERPHVVSFRGVPGPGADWTGFAWAPGEPADDPLANNYTTLAVYTPDANGEYHRQRAHCQHIMAVILDDIGTKAAAPARLAAAPPTWMIETSPGNYQAGYLLDKPADDFVQIEHLQDMFVASGLCDPGAKSPTTRLVRLPVGTNGKPGHNAWRCRLVGWEPSRTYSVADIINRLQLLQPAPKGSKTAATGTAATAPAVPIAGTDNDVVKALKAAKLYKSPLGDGKHDITCIRVHEHTNGLDHGTCYFEPDADHPRGGYSCMHSHDINIEDLREHLQLRRAQMTGKAIFPVEKGQDKRVFDRLCRILAGTGRYFRSGGVVVRVDPDAAHPFVQQTKESLGLAVDQLVTWEQWKGKQPMVADTPPHYVAQLAGAGSWPLLQEIKTIARQPYLRPDGSLVITPGYDAATETYGIFDPALFPVADQPTRADAQAALALLRGTLVEIPFDNANGEPAMLAAMQGAALRPSIDFVPMTHVTAPEAGSGKSYAAEMILLMTMQQIPAPLSFPSDEAECRKKLVTEVLEGKTAIYFDNVHGPVLAHGSLSTIITAARISDRLLGKNQSASMPAKLTIVSTANQHGVAKDLRRRGLTIDLDPQAETPASRTFKSDARAAMAAERGKYVAAALTIARAWIVAGKPRTAGVGLNGFKQWCELVCQPLMWLGIADPVATVVDVIGDDPDREHLLAFLAAFHAEIGEQPTYVKDVFAHRPTLPVTPTTTTPFDPTDPDAPPSLQEVIADIVGNARDRHAELGRWLSNHKGQIAGGYVLKMHRSGHGTKRWYVKKVQPLPASPPPP